MAEIAFLLTLWLTLIAATLVAVVLHRPLNSMISHWSATEFQTAFWVRWITVLLILIPLSFVCFAGAVESSQNRQFLLDVLHYAKWSLVGLVTSVFTMGLVLAGVIRPMMTSIAVSPRQVTDLERLLSKLDQLRAREILRQVAEANESNTHHDESDHKEAISKVL